ncbi:MAG: phosphotransferase, partial [Flavobacteriaceae bacterium]
MGQSQYAISEKEVEQFVQTVFGIHAHAKKLPGETDLNYQLETADGAFYLAKISRPETPLEYLDFQGALLNHLTKNQPTFVHPIPYRDTNGNYTPSLLDREGNTWKVRLLSWIDGRPWSHVNPVTERLRYQLGQYCGALTKALQGFDHPAAHRAFEWDIAQGAWTIPYLDLFPSGQKRILSYFQDRFTAQGATYANLRKAIVHNDANDNNIIVSHNLQTPAIVSVVDYGDAIHTQIINDLAIACAYAVMHCNDPLSASLPLIKGYNESFPLMEGELGHLFDAIAMRLVISVTKSAINKQLNPENEYL